MESTVNKQVEKCYKYITKSAHNKSICLEGEKGDSSDGKRLKSSNF